MLVVYVHLVFMLSFNFFPWFKFYFPLFKTHYHTLPYQKQRKMKFKPRKKLNHNIYKLNDLGDLNDLIGSLSQTIQQYSPPSR